VLNSDDRRSWTDKNRLKIIMTTLWQRSMIMMFYNFSMGDSDGSIDGISDGVLLGLSLGDVDGSIVGASKGISLGLSLGEEEGSVERLSDGTSLGLSLGYEGGSIDGL